MNDDEMSGAVRMPGRGVVAEVDVSGVEGDGDVVTFDYTNRLGRRSAGFVVRHDGELRAFENRCPHWSIPLVYDDEIVLVQDDIVCPMHGARFEAATGECFDGPCAGDSLGRFDVEPTGEPDRVRIVCRRTLGII